MNIQADSAPSIITHLLDPHASHSVWESSLGSTRVLYGVAEQRNGVFVLACLDAGAANYESSRERCMRVCIVPWLYRLRWCLRWSQREVNVMHHSYPPKFLCLPTVCKCLIKRMYTETYVYKTLGVCVSLGLFVWPLSLQEYTKIAENRYKKPFGKCLRKCGFICKCLWAHIVSGTLSNIALLVPVFMLKRPSLQKR